MASDNDTRNEDWLRTRSWDLPVTLNGFLHTQNFDPDRVRQFFDLPAAEAMPAALRTQVEQWLHDPRPGPGS